MIENANVLRVRPEGDESFAVVPMRPRGRPLPRRELANLRLWIGELRIEEMRDEQLMRYVRAARVLVLDRRRAADALGELFEPQIIAVSPQAFILSGYARWQTPGARWGPGAVYARFSARVFSGPSVGDGNRRRAGTRESQWVRA